ncbi:MAG: LamG domain-containing protein, partial [Ginsengibacter sp.]
MKIFTTAIKLFFISFLVGVTHLAVSAQSGNTLDFDGVNDYVDIPYNSTISNATLSVQLWVRVNTNTGNPQSIITSAASTINGGYKIYANPDGKFWLQVGNGGGTVSVEGAAISYGVWTNIAVTYDQSFVRFYVNGVLVKTVTVSGLGANPSPLPTRLGAGNTQGAANDFFGGQMHELSIWGKTLSQTEVSNNMVSSLSGTESGLYSYYNFNEGVGNGDNRTPPINTLNDLSSNHVNGTLYNFALIGTSSNWVTSSVVPVTLISFTGTNKKSSNLLTWATGSEQNSSLFEIQRSENGNDFSTLSTIAAAGNSDKLLNYQYEDHQL